MEKGDRPAADEARAGQFAIEEHYQEAPGSGAAAVLAFLHITVSGLLAFGSYYLVRHANEALLASPHLSWQFFLPAGLALALDLPTNPLSRVLGKTAQAFGALALVALLTAVLMVLASPARQFDAISTGLMFTRLACGATAGAAGAWAARRLFVRLLPSFHGR